MFILAYLISKISRVFTPTTYGEELTQFIEAQHPSSVADVEYWIEQFDRRHQKLAYGMFGYR
jgi:hypothetical protein